MGQHIGDAPRGERSANVVVAMRDFQPAPASCEACCQVPLRPADGVLHAPVRLFTQYMSADLISGIAYQKTNPAVDPLWPCSGAQTCEEYGYWARRSCGIACLQMALHHRDGIAPSMLPLVRECLRHGAYVPKPDGTVLGLVYEPFVHYIQQVHGMGGTVHRDLPLLSLRTELERGRMIMASVHKEIRRPDLPSPGRGGHLVLVIGWDSEGLHVRNPSGHTESSRKAIVHPETFNSFYAGRGISLHVARQRAR